MPALHGLPDLRLRRDVGVVRLQARDPRHAAARRVRRPRRRAATVADARARGAAGHLLRPRPHARVLPGAVAGDPRGRARGRPPLLRARRPERRSRPTRSGPTWSARWPSSTASACSPLGYRSPSADLSEATLGLLEEHGFLYDSSLMADDYRPYRRGSATASRQQEPLVRGREARAVGDPDVLRARRLAALPVQLRPVARRAVGARARCSRSGRASSTGWTSTSTAACSS